MPRPASKFKLHVQTSGRSLISQEYKNNLTRTAVELILAYVNGANSCHSNSADEPFTTPGEEYVRLAAHAQSIILEESGLFKHTMNLLGSSPGMKIIERAVEREILAEFERIDRLGGVMPAVEQRYQRSQIQAAAHRSEKQINSGERPVIGLNRYRNESAAPADVNVVRTPRERKELQVQRLAEFKRKNEREAPKALQRLSQVVAENGNVFEELLQTVEHCSLGQITHCLWERVGKFRPAI